MTDRFIIYFISRTRKKMLNFIAEQLEYHQLSGLIPSHGNILTALFEHDGKLTMKEIAELTHKDKSTITPLIRTLLNLDYITKAKDDKDKRITYILLTPKGQKIKKEYRQISSNLNQTAFKGISEKDKHTFLKVLKTMNKNFSE